MNKDDIKTSVLKRIEKTRDLLEKLKSKNTLAYLQGLHSIKTDYETIEDFDKACKYAYIIIDLLGRNVIEYERNPENDELVNDIWVTAYDTRARQGDFESFCIAMEWNRPINKQFYLPRARLLKKHGVIQGVQDLIDDKLDLLVLNLPPRIGKNLSNSTPILTKNGWKKHGDLQVGDYVLNNKGRFVKVLATSPEYPCNCRVTFANGEQIDCHKNHEWLVNDRHKNREIVIETKSMIDKVRDDYGDNKTKNHFRFGLPIIEPIVGEYKSLPVEPYCFGVWLGDGTNKNNCITISKDDTIIAETFNKYYPISTLYIHKVCGTYR